MSGYTPFPSRSGGSSDSLLSPLPCFYQRPRLAFDGTQQSWARVRPKVPRAPSCTSEYLPCSTAATLLAPVPLRSHPRPSLRLTWYRFSQLTEGCTAGKARRLSPGLTAAFRVLEPAARRVGADPLNSAWFCPVPTLALPAFGIWQARGRLLPTFASMLLYLVPPGHSKVCWPSRSHWREDREAPVHQSGARRQGATVSPLHHSVEAGVSFPCPVPSGWPWHKIPKLCYRPCWTRGNSSSAPSQEQYLSRTWQIAWELPRWRAEPIKEVPPPRHPHPARLFYLSTRHRTSDDKNDSPREDSPGLTAFRAFPSQTPNPITSRPRRGFPARRAWRDVGIDGLGCC